MLQPIEQIITDPFMRLFCRFDAVDTESGAVLFCTNGRGKGGLPKYILILPNEAPTAETVWTQYRYTWEQHNRKFIRAWSFSEALEIANQRLEKMLKLRKASSEVIS